MSDQQAGAKPPEASLSAADRAAHSTARATWVIAFFTLVTVGIGVSHYFVFHAQLDTFQGQLSAMKRQLSLMEIDQRPWVDGKVSISGDLEISDEDGPGMFSIAGIRLPLGVKLRNTGRSPALYTDFSAKMILFKYPKDYTTNPDADPVQEIEQFAPGIGTFCVTRDRRSTTGEVLFPGKRSRFPAGPIWIKTNSPLQGRPPHQGRKFKPS